MIRFRSHPIRRKTCFLINPVVGQASCLSIAGWMDKLEALPHYPLRRRIQKFKARTLPRKHPSPAMRAFIP